ncbi:MAG: hypothetical protein IJE66_08540 [Akkermansia sp.]|nr:hypothetical protein [Akkermansia sp.]
MIKNYPRHADEFVSHYHIQTDVASGKVMIADTGCCNVLKMRKEAAPLFFASGSDAIKWF